MAEHLFPKCVGYIDGSTADFAQAPVENKDAYWSRKKKYCMQFQIICDPFKVIRSLITGYPGSVHDARVYSTSALCQKPGKFFSAAEYIIGDSAYPASEYLIPPYKNRNKLTKEESKFNTYLSSKRIAVEHCIGLLKGRFSCLQGLRIQIDSKTGHKYACQWIMAACVLHNILLDRDPWNRVSDEIYEEHNENFSEIEDNNSARGELKRNSIKHMINIMNISC